jgi:hypothetical protein
VELTDWRWVLKSEMTDELKQTVEKKTYEPPRLIAISLRPEEAVLGHCKIMGSGGPVSSSCAATNCMTIGS